jgi:hypothetical protein
MGFFLQDYYRNLVLGQVQRKSLIGAAVSKHGVLGLLYERGLRRGSVRTEAKRLIERGLSLHRLLHGQPRARHRLSGHWTSDSEAEVSTADARMKYNLQTSG